MGNACNTFIFPKESKCALTMISHFTFLSDFCKRMPAYMPACQELQARTQTWPTTRPIQQLLFWNLCTCTTLVWFNLVCIGSINLIKSWSAERLLIFAFSKIFWATCLGVVMHQLVTRKKCNMWFESSFSGWSISMHSFFLTKLELWWCHNSSNHVGWFAGNPSWTQLNKNNTLVHCTSINPKLSGQWCIWQRLEHDHVNWSRIWKQFFVPKDYHNLYEIFNLRDNINVIHNMIIHSHANWFWRYLLMLFVPLHGRPYIYIVIPRLSIRHWVSQLIKYAYKGPKSDFNFFIYILGIIFISKHWN